LLRRIISAHPAGLLLLLLDATGVVLSFNLGHWLHIGRFAGAPNQILFTVVPVTLFIMYLGGVYRADLETWGLRLVIRTIISVAVAGVAIAALTYVTKSAEQDMLFWRGTLMRAYGLFMIWAVAWRIHISIRTQENSKRLRWLVIGSGERAAYLANDFGNTSINGELEYFEFDKTGENQDADLERRFDEIDQHMRKSISGIILAGDSEIPDWMLTRLMKLRLEGFRVFDLTDFYEKYLYRIPVLHIKDSWLALAHGFDLLHADSQLKLKKILDTLLAVVLLVLLSPLMLLVALLIMLDSRGSPIYSQVRTGHHGEEFRLRKFRTMVKDAEEQGAQWAAPDDPRVTRMGKILRLTRIDELPQVWNVLLGDMSFVGPRPERPHFNEMLEKEIPYYFLRHLVKPGITGWAQVMYPYGASVDDARKKLQFDLFYIKNYSLILDLVIAVKTTRVMLTGKGT
jgi:exopolysaccharide biosynthesis polyprenyl glycosylphosphotransferase